MREEEKSKILPIYKELKGLLAQAPTPEKTSALYESALWNKFNGLVDELIEVTSNELYNQYRLMPTRSSGGEAYLSVNIYRGMLNGLIMRLQGAYSLEPQDPFSGAPSTIMSQTQTQSINVQMLVQLGMDLQRALQKAETPSEKSFIEKLKEKASEVKNYVEFTNLVVSLASQFGITLERLKTLFGQHAV